MKQLKFMVKLNLTLRFNEKNLDEILKNLYSTEFFEDVSVEINK